ncbi:EF-hand domain-containing protein [Plasmodiophora brassicae]|uniref:EF-hand domain-containing protein n=1 Tax=Plasmodiophora brassicae TaxID=37360 RepID=A0A0G4IJZ1_PLABS|nr:hypothetical protein PBRA_004133 [Plasmodiophora brassicae]SPR00284.1 unnamed protein product [Plasmodiophora brassicae]
MGNVASAPMSPSKAQQMAALANGTFDEEEIRRLHKRFKKIDTDKSGGVSLDEFLAVPYLMHNPLVKRVMEIFDADKNGQVDFKEFIDALSIFTSSGDQDASRLAFVFRIYDVNNDGYISNGDLFAVLKIMVGDNLTEVQLQQLVDRTIATGDTDCDGKLSFEEFSKMVAESNIESKLTLEI